MMKSRPWRSLSHLSTWILPTTQCFWISKSSFIVFSASLCCNNKTVQTEWFVKMSWHLFPTVPEAGCTGSGMQWVWLWLRLTFPMGRRDAVSSSGKREKAQTLSIKPVIRTSTIRADHLASKCFTSQQWWGLFLTWILGDPISHSKSLSRVSGGNSYGPEPLIKIFFEKFL